jgi:GNAT superfamily N-acetyltransferase
LNENGGSFPGPEEPLTILFVLSFSISMDLNIMDTTIEFSLRDGFDQMNFDVVSAMLSGSYWCKGIRKDEVITAAQNSALVAGAFVNNQQVGYARIISDKSRFAYFLDVIVDENYRRQGIGQALVKYIMDHPEVKDVYQWLLITRDAHGVYSKLGFAPVARPADWMEIRKPRPER